MEEVISYLLAIGFEEDGGTQVIRHGVLTNDEKPRIADIGGRLRFRKGDWFATVGKRTSCIYRKENKEIVQSENFSTKQMVVIQQYLTNNGLV